MKSLIAYAQLVRLPNTFTAMADILLGALASGLLFRSWATFLCLLVSSICLYWSGMVWNDYFDLDQDRKERPGRPIASGRISLRSAFVLATLLMLFGLLGAGLADFFSETQRIRSLPIAGAIILCIFLYDGVFKATWIGPIMMGLCRFFNILLGLSILGTMPPLWGWLLAIIIGTYIAGVTWFARTEARESSQTMLAAAGSVMLASLVLALTVPALVMEVQGDPRFPTAPEPSRLYPYILAGFGGFLGLAVLRAIKRPEPRHVQPAVKRAILGLVVLDALLASAFIGSLGLLLAVLLIPGIILGRWLYST